MSGVINPATPWRATTTLEPTVHHVPRSQNKPAPPEPGQLATAAQYNLREAPTYVPPPRAAVRAGADDFLLCRSVGQRC